MMNATMKSNYNRSRSPLFGVAAVVATAVTMGIAVLLPANITPTEPMVAAAPATQSADMRIVTTIEVVGVREAKAATHDRWVVPAVFKHKG